ncbi:putative myosin-15 [Sesbania bispinosa]|nr:putative myosin-15 [Sesbania bispinosa]
MIKKPSEYEVSVSKLNDYEFKVKSLLERCIRRTRRRFYSKAIIDTTDMAARSTAIGGMVDAAFRALIDMDHQVDDDPYMNLELSDDDEPTNPTGEGGGDAANQEEEDESVVEVLKTKKRKKNVTSDATTVRGKGKKAIDMAVVMKDQMNVDMPMVSVEKTSQEAIEKMNLKVTEVEGKLKDEKTVKENVEKEKTELEDKLKLAQTEIATLEKQVSTRQSESSSADRSSKVDYAKRAVQKASEKWQEERKKASGGCSLHQPRIL